MWSANLPDRGVRFVQSVDEVPDGAKLIFSAHGIAPAVWEQAKKKNLQVIIDATCPLVEKVHREVRKFAAQGYWIILVGHEKHDEIIGTRAKRRDISGLLPMLTKPERSIFPTPKKLSY